MAKIDYSDFDIEKEFNVRDEFDPKITPYAIENIIQRSADNIIKECPNADWNENLITYKIIESIRNTLSHYDIPGTSHSFPEKKFNLEAYKLTGSAENFHGDIAFIITRRFTENSKPISGIAFYEAKASNNNRHHRKDYPSFCTNQLRRLVTHTPKLNYLIYNKAGCDISNNDWPAIPTWREELSGANYNRVHAAVIDANFLKANKCIDFSLRNIGLSFGSHFVHRILSGKDLDYSRTVEKNLRRWLKYTRNSSPIIISVSILDESDDYFGNQLELPGFERITLERHIQALVNKNS